MATEIIFTENPADFPKLEAMYVVERDPPGFIQGVDLSRVGMATKTVRGPTTVQLMTQVSRIVEVYGDRDYGDGGALINKLVEALYNKRFGAIYVKRVAAADSVVASFEAETLLDGTGVAVLRIAASSTGLWGAGIQWQIEAATDADATHFNLRLKYLGDEITHENLNINTATDDNLAAVVGDDIARLITLTKLADGRPANNLDVTEAAFVSARDVDGFLLLGDVAGAAYTGVDGIEGTLVAADYTAAVTELANTNGPAVVMVPESLEETVAAAAQAVLNAVLVTLASLSTDKLFPTWSGKYGQTPAQEITDVGTQITTRSDRIIWCYNGAKTLDPTTSLNIDTGPHVWMSSILSQTDVDIHPGSTQAGAFLAGIRELNNEALSNGDLILLKAAGISTLEKLPDRFQFRSGVVTLLTSGKTEITRRRMVDFLQLSASDRLKTYVKDKGTVENRAQIQAELAAFSTELEGEERIVEDFAIDQDSVNTAAQRGRGIEKVFWQVNLIDHILALVLETEIGSGVVIESAT